MIEVVNESNLDELLPLIRQYQEFYQVVEISDSKNRDFFAQFGEQNPSGCQFLDRQDSTVVGFATVFFSYSSTLAAKVAVLNDLFTVPQRRGNGVGRRLIEHCRAFAAEQGAIRLQWLTAPQNETAMKLYDSLDAAKSSWNFYAYKV